MLEMCMRKRRGLRTEPLGTPTYGVKGVEMKVEILTFICLLLRKLEMMDWVGLGSLRLLSRSL